MLANSCPFILSTSVLWSLFVVVNSNVNITFLFAGDFQGIYTEYPTVSGKPAGGVARLKTLLNNSVSIFVFVGNIIETLSGNNMERVKLATKMLEEMHPTAFILGRNEFAMSPENLEWFVSNAHNVILSANLEHKELDIPQDKMIDYDGVGIVVIGYTSEEVEMMQGSSNFHVANIIQSLNDKSRAVNLAFPSIRLYVAAGCTGIESAKKIAEGTSQINIFMSACSPTLLWHKNGSLPEQIYKYGDYPTKVKNRDGKDVLIVHSFGTSKFLGKLAVQLNERGAIEKYDGEMMYVDTSVPMDPTVTDLLRNEKQAPKLLTGKIGRSRVYLDGVCIKSECNLGNLVTDAFIQYKSDLYEGEHWTDTPIALLAGGNIKGNINTSIHNGTIMAEDLSNALQDVYQMVTITLQGEDLRAALEYAVDVPDKAGSEKFLQVSGIRMVYDNRRSPGDKTISITVRCAKCMTPAYEPLDPNKIYKVITMENVVTGQFGHVSLTVKPFLLHYENITNWDIVLGYIQTQEVVAAANSDRISQLPLISSAKRWSHRITALSFSMLSCFNLC